ncbi:PREDICTED: zinc finger [Prunus dulcis]|uniref:PREDICTED: zinc finger n=1 Tax=Prunus dulcis TaxID=3755 RepID=A0A5E4GC84_PRUDU|nr:hypothetical protein L3X38_036491 [Prunus dulcis]VVA37306.1 PREDICTED: zinc finger [Prunus dulcis]
MLMFLPYLRGLLNPHFHLKTGQCKFGATCKFHHPKDILIPSAEQENTTGETGTTIQLEGTRFAMKAPVSFSPALSFNSKGFPVRLGEPDCPFYLIGSLDPKSDQYLSTFGEKPGVIKGSNPITSCHQEPSWDPPHGVSR